ncbi:hypothetical protein WJX74_007798 [Apatococcus lobatus]|uniref:Major facilitator superfamily (MFS) profile domain-containing protein n=2 Tax=Apatococcus TaxID=904362 RepID=A0AAW1SQ02_9CHLO
MDPGSRSRVDQDSLPTSLVDPLLESVEATADLLHPSSTSSLPQWYTPHRLMALFCSILFLAYLDMGCFASNGVNGSLEPRMGIQGDFNLSYFADGVLPAAFMIGLMGTSALLTSLTARFNPFRLIGIGMALWGIGAVACGLAQGFWTLLVARMLVGSGEASIITLSAPFIDDAAPPKAKSRWFAFLSVFPSLGVAAGYFYGEAVSEAYGWRVPFFLEATFAVPVVAFTLLAPPVDLKGRSKPQASDPGTEADKAGAGDTQGSRSVLLHDMRILHRHPVFLLNAYGYVPIQACLGAFTYWGPKAAMQIFDRPKAIADNTIGALTICTSIAGTMGGGYLLDKMGSSLQNGMTLSAASAAVALVACEAAFLLARSFVVFCAVLGVGLLGLFLATAPLYAVSMWAVPAEQRPSSQALLVITMHLCGDVPAPPLVGALQGVLLNWRYSTAILVAGLVISVALYSIGIPLAKSAPDYRDMPSCQAVENQSLQSPDEVEEAH